MIAGFLVDVDELFVFVVCCKMAIGDWVEDVSHEFNSLLAGLAFYPQVE